MSSVESFATEQPLQGSTAHPTQLGIGLEKVSQKELSFSLLVSSLRLTARSLQQDKTQYDKILC